MMSSKVELGTFIETELVLRLFSFEGGEMLSSVSEDGERWIPCLRFLSVWEDDFDFGNSETGGVREFDE